MNTPLRIAFLCLSLTTAFAGPVATVPWNGHTGAASFTYDDSRTSQLPNLLPQLDSLKLKATFFVSSTGTGGDFEQKKSDWIKVAQRGHEVTNHTRKHENVPADPNAAAVITDMAKYLRDMDPGMESVTFAYPNCAVNGKTGVGGENFMARGCGDAHYSWNTQPSDWMNVLGYLLTPTAENGAIASLNAAKTGNSWVTMLSHDVKANPDQYSITPQTNLKLLQTAIANGLWIDTYARVGAYYRAHFVMDAVNPSATGAGWSMTWTSPHPRMPKSVMLRVKLAAATFGNSFTVQQGGVTIPAESDGSYLIDFMKLSMTVIQGSTGIRSGAFLPERLQARALRDGIGYAGVVGEPEALVTDLRGAVLFRGRVSGGRVPMPRERMRGVLLLTLTDSITGKSVRAAVQAIR